jgi:hypothetical protein
MLSQFPFPMIPLGRINKLLFSGRALAIFANQKQRKEAAREREKGMHRWQLFLRPLQSIRKTNSSQYSQGNASIRGIWFLMCVPPEKKRRSRSSEEDAENLTHSGRPLFRGAAAQ